MDVILWLGYLGVIYGLIRVVRKVATRTHKRVHYVSMKKKKEIISKKKILRTYGPAMILLTLLAYCGLWYLFGFLPDIYVHLFILMTAYYILEYINVTIEDALSLSLPSVENNIERDKILRYTGIFKKLWYINALLLLFFCIGYTQVKDFPFHGIWGIIAWSCAISLTYFPVVAFYIDPFKELALPRERRFYIMSIVLSWIITWWLFWLERSIFIYILMGP